MEENKTLLTISLLVSNRIDTIRKCMESIRPILEQLPSELIVVDTVGEENSDGSLAVAKEYATKVAHFDWCNDFAAARNAGLSLAEGEWFLVTDDDEWFEDVTPIISFFQSKEYINYDRAGYEIRNYTDLSGKKYDASYRSGLMRLFPNSSYVGKVHEHLVPIGEKEKQLPVYVHHYGYAYKNEEEKQAHAKRNMTLIQEELKENPNDLRMLAQLVQEYKSLDDLAAEKELCEQIVANYQGDKTYDLFQYILINLIRATRETDRKEGKQKLAWVEQNYTLNPVNYLYCVLEHIACAIQEQEWEQVIGWSKQYVTLQRQLPKQQYCFPEYNDVASEEKLQIVVLEGIKAMHAVQQFEVAEYFFDAVNWGNQESKPYEQMELLLKVYGATTNGKLLFVHANRIIKNKKLISIFQTMIHTFVSENPEKLESMRKHLAGEF